MGVGPQTRFALTGVLRLAPSCRGSQTRSAEHLRGFSDSLRRCWPGFSDSLGWSNRLLTRRRYGTPRLGQCPHAIRWGDASCQPSTSGDCTKGPGRVHACAPGPGELTTEGSQTRWIAAGFSDSLAYTHAVTLFGMVGVTAETKIIGCVWPSQALMMPSQQRQEKPP